MSQARISLYSIFQRFSLEWKSHPQVDDSRGLAQRLLIQLQLVVKRQIAAPELLHKNVVDNPRGFNQLGQRFLVTRAERLERSTSSGAGETVPPSG